jgi:hypothetical protein
MSLIAAQTVKWAALGKEAIAAFVFGVGVVGAFGLLVLGSARMKRDERPGTVALPLAVAAVGGLLCVAALVIGFIAMTHKSS